MSRALSAFLGFVISAGLLVVQYLSGSYFVNGPLRAASSPQATTVTNVKTADDTCLSGDADACAREADALSLVSGRVGEPLSLATYKITVLQVESGVASYGLIRPREGYKLIAIKLAVESKAERGVTVNSYFARLRDASGLVYKTITGGRAPLLLPVTNLERHNRVDGWMTFEVLQDARELMLTYQLTNSADRIEVALDAR